nr:MAG TPA: hypothetical protein [Caudoviricetes sp.]
MTNGGEYVIIEILPAPTVRGPPKLSTGKLYKNKRLKASYFLLDINL